MIASRDLHASSVLGLFLSPPEIRKYLKKYPALSYSDQSLIFREGESSRDLIIPLSGKIKLSSGVGAQSKVMGELKAFRAANLYALLRHLPLQYSGMSEGPTQVFILPWSELEPALSRMEHVEKYLKLVTEYTFLRKMGKELAEFGCEKAFIIRFLGAFRLVTWAPHTWILQEGQVPSEMFMVIQGSVLASKKKASGEPSSPFWNVPERSWQNYRSLIHEVTSRESLRSLSSVQALTWSREELLRLRKDFRRDFKILDRWIKTFSTPLELKIDEGLTPDVEGLISTFKKLPRGNPKYRLKYPFIQQNEEMDCGPACLAMISAYFGNDLSIQYWRDQVSVGRDGTTLLDLGVAAEKSHLIAHGLGVETLAELEDCFFPLIALRQYHYVVVYKVSREKIILGDPAVGIRVLHPDEFFNGFEKAILILRPTDDFFKITVPDRPYAHYFHWMNTFSREIFLALAASILLVSLSIVSPLIVQTILDHVLAIRDVKLLAVVIGFGCAMAVVQSILLWIRSYFLNYISAHYTFHASSAFLKKLFSLPYSFFHTRHVGDFIHRLNELDHVREFCSATLIGLLLDFLSLVVCLGIIFSYNFQVGMSILILAPFLILISMSFSRRLNLTYSEVFNGYVQQEGLITDLIQGVATIKTLHAEVSARWRFEENLVRTLRARQRFSNLDASLTALGQAYEQILFLLLLGFAAYLEIRGKLSPGQIVALSMFVAYTIKPFRGLAQAWSSIQQMKSTLARLNEVLLAQPETASRPRALKKKSLQGEIEFRDVYFRFGGESSDWVLKGISFKIEAGQNVAIVGPSGSGKSTLAHLLVRLFDPTQGQILLDGRDIRDYDLSWLRQQIGYLQQAAHLFQGSIADNIGFNSPSLSYSRLEKCAEIANAQPFIDKKPFGYGTLLNHGGLGLSGGEKQRLALARLFYGDPSLFCLDEATASLDNLSERTFLHDFKKAASGKTILNIAHRQSTVLMSEFALLIKDGKVAGFGTHEDLDRDNGLYQELFHSKKDGVKRAA